MSPAELIMSQAEEIKAKLDIVEVIREYVNVKVAGANFQALCPFHNEKTPSFIISPDKQIWHCFGCGRGGDVFSFVMEKEGLSFPEALRLLAPKAGVVLQYENPDNYARRNRLLDILELAGKYYARLLEEEAGREARDYLKRRGLPSETIKEWQLGYSPDAWDKLYQFLKTRPLAGAKYTDEEIFLAGLTVRKEGDRGYYDRFRDRVIFPISDLNHNLIAFTARVNPAKEATEKMGKYINSPQTPVYDKSRVLFGLDKAKAAIREADLAIIVEGQMDAISCHVHGFKNAVASSGTALTGEQVALLKRFSNNVALCFDMDAAGQLAADRGIREVLSQDLNLKVVVLPLGKDPDECLRKDPEEFGRAVAEAKPMLAYYFKKITAGLDLEKLENKQAVRDQMFAMIDLVRNKTEQGHWLKKLSEELDFSENDMREDFAAWKSKQKAGPRRNKAAAEEAKREDKSRAERLAELLLALLLKFPEFIGYALSNLEPEFMAGAENSRFYNDFIIYYQKAGDLDYDDLRLYLEAGGEGREKFLDKLALLGEKDFYDYEAERVKAEIIKIIVDLKKCGCQRRIQKLEKAIAAAEADGKSEELELLMSELKNLTDELKAVDLSLEK